MRLWLIKFLQWQYKYLKIIECKSDMSLTTTYVKSANYKPKFLINPTHIFNSNGFRSVIISDKSPETINPLDFKSQYSKSDFTTAISSKVISDAFVTLEKPKLDKVTILLLGNILMSLAIIYLMVK